VGKSWVGGRKVALSVWDECRGTQNGDKEKTITSNKIEASMEKRNCTSAGSQRTEIWGA